MKIVLFVDLNTEDDTGLPWTYLDQAVNSATVVPRRLLVVGAGSATAIAEVVDVAADGLVHVPERDVARQADPLPADASR